MNPRPAPSVPGNTEWERFGNAAPEVSSAPSETIQKECERIEKIAKQSINKYRRSAMKPKVLGYPLLGLVLLAMSGSNAQQPPRVTGFFTDMHYIQETGDVLGDEVWIVYARGKFWATVQIAEGSPEPPVVVPVEVSGSTVKFAITQKQVGPDGKPVPDLVIPFEGTVTQFGLSGTANSGPFNLQRHASFWQ